MSFGNSIDTRHAYKPHNRRLVHLEGGSAGYKLQDQSYLHDNVGN